MTAVFNVSALGTTSSGNSYDQLIAMGYPEDFLNCITDDMMDIIVASVGSYEAFDITYNNDERPINYGDKDDIVVQIVTAQLKDESSEVIFGECVCVYWVWEQGEPIAKQADRVQIQWEWKGEGREDGFVSDSFYAEDYQIKDNEIHVSNTYTALAEIRQYGRYTPSWYNSLYRFEKSWWSKWRLYVFYHAGV